MTAKGDEVTAWPADTASTIDETLSNCPRCGYDDADFDWGDGTSRVVCLSLECEFEGPSAEFDCLAVLAWNEAAEKEVEL